MNELHKSIIDKFNNGESIGRIKKETGTLYLHVLQILQENNIDLSSIKTNFNNIQIEQILEYHRNNIPPHIIAKKIQKSTSAVMCLLIKKGFKLKKHKVFDRFSQTDKDDIIRLYNNNVSLYQIAQKYKTYSPTIKTLLIKLIPEKSTLIHNYKKILNIDCKICNKSMCNWVGLQRHVLMIHQITSQEYYDKYLKKENDGLCVICGKETKYIDITHGYNKTCCQSHGTKMFRRNLKNDSKKYKTFQEKVSLHRKHWWANLTEIEKINHSTKAGLTNKIRMDKLTPQEKQDKYGWMNKLSVEQKHKFINDIMLKTGSHRWHQTATPEQKLAAINKGRDNILKKRGFVEGLSGFDYIMYRKYFYYKREVEKYTRKTYQKYKELINPTNLKRSRSLQLDHKFSISQGFIDRVDPIIISSPYNLQLLSQHDNNSKNYKCSITKEELFNLYEQDQLQSRNIYSNKPPKI